METCLANTGISVFASTGIGLALIAFTVLLWRISLKRKIHFVLHAVVAVVFLCTISVSPKQASAAPVCPSAAKPDTSTGVKGASQVFNVLANDTPSAGSTFVLSSLRLGLVSGHVLGASISVDQKTVTSPTEGVYNAQNNGTIQFTPDPNFVNTATGVVYYIEDTAGKTASSTYIPTVVESIGQCDPANSLRLASYTGISSGFNDGDILTSPIASHQVDWLDVAGGSSGSKVVGIGTLTHGGSSIYTFTSNNSGATWVMHPMPNTFTPKYIASSADGTKLLAVGTDYDGGLDEWTTYIYKSTDSGLTWNTQTINPGYPVNALASSADGTKLALAGVSSVHTSSDSGATWSAHAVGTSFESSAIASSADGSKLAVLGADDDGNVLTPSPTVYTSSNSGVSWTPNAIGANFLTTSIASSADGTKLVIGGSDYDGGVGDYIPFVYTSTDSGTSWVSQLIVSGFQPTSVTSSSNGDLLAMAGTVTGATSTSSVYTSSDSGYNWTEHANVAALDPQIYGTASGSNLVAVGRVVDWSDIHTTQVGTSSNGGTSWATSALVSQMFIASQVDLDPSTAGQQLTIDKTSTNGWTATYDTATDTLTYSISNSTLATSTSLDITYTIATGSTGCPITIVPGTINWSVSSGAG